MNLSIDRTISVVNAQVSQHSFSEAILKSCGDGPAAPVATNYTYERRFFTGGWNC